jgi:hypothetical protein
MCDVVRGYNESHGMEIIKTKNNALKKINTTKETFTEIIDQNPIVFYSMGMAQTLNFITFTKPSQSIDST